MIADVNDIRTNLGEKDSLELRLALSTYLQQVFDNLERSRQNVFKEEEDFSNDE